MYFETTEVHSVTSVRPTDLNASFTVRGFAFTGRSVDISICGGIVKICHWYLILPLGWVKCRQLRIKLTENQTQGINWMPDGPPRNQTNSSKSVCVNTFYQVIVRLEKIVILLTANTNCDSFQTREIKTGKSISKFMVFFRSFIFASKYDNVYLKGKHHSSLHCF